METKYLFVLPVRRRVPNTVNGRTFMRPMRLRVFSDRRMPGAARCAAVFAALSVVLLTAGAPARAETNWGRDSEFPVQLTIGVQATLPPSFRAEVLKPTERYLKEALPAARIVYRDMAIDDLKREVSEGRIRAYFADPGFFSDLQSEGRSEELVALRPPETLDPTYSTGIAVVVPATSPVTRLSDLEARTVVSDRPDNFGTQIIFEGLLADEGVPTDRMRFVYTDFVPPAPLLRLARGEADAAVVPTCELEWAVEAGLLVRSDFRVLDETTRFSRCARSSKLFPSVIFGASSSLDASAARALTVALLEAPSMPTGAAWSIVTDFSSVKDLYRRLMRGPYEYLRAEAAPNFWERHRQKILWGGAMLLGALLFVLGYLAHVRALVRRRTRELEAVIREKDRTAGRERTLREKLERMERAGIVSELSSFFAHEMRQPVAAVTAFAGALKLYAKENFPDDRLLTHTSSRIVEEAERVSEIVERVRGYARGRRHPSEVRGAMSLLDEALAGFRLSSVSSGLTVHVFADGDPAVEVEPLEMTLVLLNLLKNAATAMRRSEATTLAVSVGTERETEGEAGGGNAVEAQNTTQPVDARVVFRIADFGPKVSDATIAALEAGEAPGSGSSEGLGLGLMLVRTVVEAHGGELRWRRTEPERGLTVEVRLPARDSAASTSSHKEIRKCLQF